MVQHHAAAQRSDRGPGGPGEVRLGHLAHLSEDVHHEARRADEVAGGQVGGVRTVGNAETKTPSPVTERA